MVSGLWKFQYEGLGWGYDGYGLPFPWLMNGTTGEFQNPRWDFLLPSLVLDVFFYSAILLVVLKFGITARRPYIR